MAKIVANRFSDSEDAVGMIPVDVEVTGVTPRSAHQPEFFPSGFQGMSPSCGQASPRGLYQTPFTNATPAADCGFFTPRPQNNGKCAKEEHLFNETYVPSDDTVATIIETSWSLVTKFSPSPVRPHSDTAPEPSSFGLFSRRSSRGPTAERKLFEKFQAQGATPPPPSNDGAGQAISPCSDAFAAIPSSDVAQMPTMIVSRPLEKHEDVNSKLKDGFVPSASSAAEPQQVVTKVCNTESCADAASEAGADWMKYGESWDFPLTAVEKRDRLVFMGQKDCELMEESMAVRARQLARFSAENAKIVKENRGLHEAIAVWRHLWCDIALDSSRSLRHRTKTCSRRKVNLSHRRRCARRVHRQLRIVREEADEFGSMVEEVDCLKEQLAKVLQENERLRASRISER